MKISKAIGLAKSQIELEFVDYDLNKDTPLFLDPYFIANKDDEFCRNAHKLIQSFFNYVIFLLKEKRYKEARELFSYLSEFKESNLGLSTGKPKGKGIGKTYANKLFNSLKKSKAVETGLLEDIQDVSVFVEGIAKDRMSDMICNIIKKELIKYTKEQCVLYGVPTKKTSTGYYWDDNLLEWKTDYEERLIVKGKPYVLIPKFAVCYSIVYTTQKCIDYFVLNFLQDEHLRLQSSLVTNITNKKGEVIRQVVYKNTIREDYAKKNIVLNKEFLRKFIVDHKEVYDKFKQEIKDKLIKNEEILGVDKESIIDSLISGFKDISSGVEHASQYHMWAMSVLEVLVYPTLINPIKEDSINNGRKRIDITFENAAEQGFFYQLPTIHQVPCSKILIECKNYTNDIANNELDQMNGRFNMNRGKFGIVCCREIDNKKLLLERCSDFIKDQQHFIIVLTDDDLISCLTEYKNGNTLAIEDLIQRKYFELIK